MRRQFVSEEPMWHSDEDEEEEEGELKDEDESSEKVEGWAHLPEVILRQVFRRLNHIDRGHAAQVCRHWHHVMQWPVLWRRRTFCFSGQGYLKHMSEVNMALCYVHTYGRYLEHLELSFMHPFNRLVARRFMQIMKVFLATLHTVNTKLRSLTIKYLELDRTAWHYATRSSLVHSLAGYLYRHGSHLRQLSLRMARLKQFQGLKVLEAVAASQMANKPGITSLNLEDFFSHQILVHSCPTFPEVMSRFQGLTRLTLNYNCISDQLLAALATSCCSGRAGYDSLQSLTLYCPSHELHQQTINGEMWTFLAQQCPDLRVYMIMDRVMGIEHLSWILKPQIPLRALSLTSSFFNQQQWTAKPILTQLLPRFSHCLHKLTLDLNNRHESVDDELLQAVQACPKLYFLKVRAFMQVTFLEQLLQLRQERKTHLSIIKVYLYSNDRLTQEDKAQLEEISHRYRQLIKTKLEYYAVDYYTF